MASQKKISSKRARTNAKEEATAFQNFQSEPELVVIARAEAELRVTSRDIASLSGMNVEPINNILKLDNVSFQTLFRLGEVCPQQNVTSTVSKTGVEVPNLSVYYRVLAPQERLTELAEELREQEIVEHAYIKPPVEPYLQGNLTPRSEEAPLLTPDFIARQGYLEIAPEGIDARYAWQLPGGFGQSVSILDIEGAWRFTHEDLQQNQRGVVGGQQSTDINWRNHGTAVVGILGGDRGSFGVTGICPDANICAISSVGAIGSSAAIQQAADKLNPGDIILVELHRAGPRFGFKQKFDQRGYIAIEWWPDDFDAIRYATSRDIIVVESAGNGRENLDDDIYNQRPNDFPTDWSNPFNRANRDSGAIVVGAGAPPSGNHGPDRSRLNFSNYGMMLDAQGWGDEVTTTGYGDLQGGSNEDVWYTSHFGGTSSAAPIVVGAIACLQGILRASANPSLTPLQMRALLRNTGSPQQDASGRPATQRIGNRPNLREMIKNTRL